MGRFRGSQGMKKGRGLLLISAAPPIPFPPEAPPRIGGKRKGGRRLKIEGKPAARTHCRIARRSREKEREKPRDTHILAPFDHMPKLPCYTPIMRHTTRHEERRGHSGMCIEIVGIATLVVHLC